MNNAIKQIKETIGVSWARDLAISFLLSVVVSLSGALSLKLPFTLVPMTLQLHLILFFSLFLGKRGASMMVGWYLVQGAMGYPVFALGASGIATLLGPRGGYLIGYLIAAYVVGYLREISKKKGFFAAVLQMGAGNLVIYLFGYVWLSRFLGVKEAFLLGIAPFLITDCLKLIAFAKISTTRLHNDVL